MRPTPVKNNFKDQFYNDVMPFIYNIGAAIVIFGAMFKLLNLPEGNLMLGLGLSTEALIFVLGAFEPKPQEVDWSRVYPELAPNYKVDLANNAPKPSYSVTQKLDQCLEQASIDLPLLENLATTMRRFSENMASVPSFAGVSQVTEAYVSHVAQATQVIGELAKFNDTVADVMRSFTASSSQEKLTNYFGQIDEMAHTLTAMNGVYKKALADMESQTTHTGTLCNHLDTALQAMEVAGAQVINFKEELALLNEKVTALNAIYAKTLTAFKG